MADVAQLLSTLHPMREPPPPASVLPYLLTLAVGIATAAAGLLAAFGLRQHRRGLRVAAEAVLAASRRLGPSERLAAQAGLLRRLVRAARGETEARADGTAWLAALDRTFATTFFSQGPGRAFADSLYRRTPTWDGELDLDEIDRALGRLIAGANFGIPRRSRA